MGSLKTTRSNYSKQSSRVNNPIRDAHLLGQIKVNTRTFSPQNVPKKQTRTRLDVNNSRQQQDKTPSTKLREREKCKSRPNPHKTSNSGGKSRDYVPWCK